MKEIGEMTVDEVIEKYCITLLPDLNGEANKLRVFKKFTSEEKEALAARKPEILAELKRRQAEEERRLDEEIALQEAAIKAIENEKIVARHYDGEYLSAYQVFGVAGELLESIGAAEYVEGWGYRVDDAIIAKFGTEFTFPQVREYMEAARNAKKAEILAKLRAKFEEARKTGKPVLLQANFTQCDGSACECGGDLIERFAFPDGSVKETRTHTY